MQQFRHIGFQRDEIGRIFRVAADRNRTRDMTMDQTERTAEQVDTGGDDWRSDAVIVDDERLDEIVKMALVIRDVDSSAASRRRLRDLDVLVNPFDLAQDRIERMFERAIDRIPLRRPQLVEVGVNAFAGFELRLAVPAAQVPRYILPRQYGLADVVEHARTDYIKHRCSSILASWPASPSHSSSASSFSPPFPATAQPSA